MALVSLKNFFSPFQNKGGLITILLLVIAFAVFRFSGGGIKLTPINTKAPTLKKPNTYYAPPKPTNKNTAPSEQDEEYEF